MLWLFPEIKSPYYPQHSGIYPENPPTLTVRETGERANFNVVRVEWFFYELPPGGDGVASRLNLVIEEPAIQTY
jgi:hypothetical protein